MNRTQRRKIRRKITLEEAREITRKNVEAAKNQLSPRSQANIRAAAREGVRRFLEQEKQKGENGNNP